MPRKTRTVRARLPVLQSEEMGCAQPRISGNALAWLGERYDKPCSQTEAYRKVNGGEIMGSKVTRQYGFEVHTLAKLLKCQDRYLNER